MKNHIVELLKKAKELHNKNKINEAKKIYHEIILDEPANFEALNYLGIIYCQKKEYFNGLKYFDKGIYLKPDQAGIYINKGNTLIELNKMYEAIDCYNKALSLQNNLIDAHINKGIALEKINLLNEAIESYDKALIINPNIISIYINKGNILKNLLKLNDAIKCYDQGLKLKPDFPDLKWNKSIALLLNGQLEKGWKYYESRWTKKNFTSEVRNFKQPFWDGNYNINDKIILIHSEQGLGDTIQFFRYVKLVLERGAKVILELPKPLIKLIINSNKDLTNLLIIKKGDVIPNFDYHCPMLSLPLAFKTNIKSIPNKIPYIFSNKLLIESWSKKIDKRKFNIGVCWHGSTYADAEGRSFPLKFLEKISTFDNVALFSLQKTDGVNELNSLPKNMKVNTFGVNLDKEGAFLDSAKIMQNMDLIISADTAITHLAGALGCKIWLILKFLPDWRWMLNMDNSPWYPFMKIFRQESDGDWSMAFSFLEKELQKIITNKI